MDWSIKGGYIFVPITESLERCALILNTQSGNVSPQFHCIYDDEFSTCKRDAKFASLWQYKAKLQLSKPGVIDKDQLKHIGELTKQLPKHMQHDWDQPNEVNPM